MADAATTIRDRPRRPRQGGDEGSPVATAPHDLDMEESLLGAMLLDECARAAALEACRPGDFYRPAHGLVFSAISGLSARSAPVDAVTVADELARAGLLGEFGDAVQLVALQANTASIGHAAYYAERVASLAAERRLLGHALELTAAVRDGDPDARQRALDAIAFDGSDAARIGHQLVREDVGALMRDAVPLPEPELLARTDGKHLLLRGMVHILHGEPSAGKSWVAAEAVRQVTASGEAATVLDYENHGAIWAARFVALGATPTDVDLLDYFRPGAVPHHVLATEASKRAPALVVIDALAGALAQSGLDENSNSETLMWLRQVARPIAQSGAAVLVLDHVSKDKDTRGRWMRGASAKLGETDVAFGIEVDEPYSRSSAGAATLRIAKDRHGAIGPERSVAAVLRFTPADGGASLTIDIEPPPPEAQEGWSPTDAMSAVADALRSADGNEMSVSALANYLHATGKGYKRSTVATAAERLALDPRQPVVVRSSGRSRLFRWDSNAVPLLYALPDPDDELEPF